MSGAKLIGKSLAPLVRRSTNGGRACIICAGWPVALWPLCIAIFYFNLALLASKGATYETSVGGEWEAILQGARVLYFAPQDAKRKLSRFEGYAPYGLYAEPMLDMRLRGAYAVIAEKSLIDRGVLRFIVTEKLRVALDEEGEIQYSASKA